jgi:hypothetical protein
MAAEFFEKSAKEVANRRLSSENREKFQLVYVEIFLAERLNLIYSAHEAISIHLNVEIFGNDLLLMPCACYL